MASTDTDRTHMDFRNLDDFEVYTASRERALDASTLNFVVEFGKNRAEIAFDLDADGINDLSTRDRTATPVRWINIWGPDRQSDIVKVLGKKYKFSPRLQALIQTERPATESKEGKDAGKRKSYRSSKSPQKENFDVEANPASIEMPRIHRTDRATETASHYAIAKEMMHYQSVDVGSHFLCVGANWMHELPEMSAEASITDEGDSSPLWTWLVLCDDNTVISLHEDPGRDIGDRRLKRTRGNTVSVLSQLSSHGLEATDPISMQTVRQALELDTTQSDSGVEGSSNLFYYLFDDWRAVYATISAYRQRLKKLRKVILEDVTRKSNTVANIEIIPRLHVLGSKIRQMLHLYEGYKNLTVRILESKVKAGLSLTSGVATPMASFHELPSSRGVVLAPSASGRFERLGDRLQLLILREMEEFLAEKDALISTYFNINAQKDSEATARLTRSATLLAKLSVLFLPVSLMTSYFSVQIDDLNHYTGKDYWYTFAVIMSVSFLALFFFSRLLMWVTEVLDAWIKHIMKPFADMVQRRWQHRKAQSQEE